MQQPLLLILLFNINRSGFIFILRDKDHIQILNMLTRRQVIRPKKTYKNRLGMENEIICGFLNGATFM